MLARQGEFRGGTVRHMGVQAILEWAFRAEKVSLELPEGFEVMLGRGYGRGTWARFAQLEALGCHVDGGGSSDSHEEAEVVAAIVANLTDMRGGRMMAIKVAEYARAGAAPDWLPGAQRAIVPVEIKGDGDAVTASCGMETVTAQWTDRLGRTRSRARRIEVRWCPVIERPQRRYIERQRVFYGEWWLALSEIRRNLQACGMLRQHIVTDQMPPKAPWSRSPLRPEIDGLGPNGWHENFS